MTEGLVYCFRLASSYVRHTTNESEPGAHAHNNLADMTLESKAVEDILCC